MLLKIIITSTESNHKRRKSLIHIFTLYWVITFFFEAAINFFKFFILFQRSTKLDRVLTIERLVCARESTHNDMDGDARPGPGVITFRLCMSRLHCLASTCHVNRLRIESYFGCESIINFFTRENFNNSKISKHGSTKDIIYYQPVNNKLSVKTLVEFHSRRLDFKLLLWRYIFAFIFILLRRTQNVISRTSSSFFSPNKPHVS